MEYVLKIVLYVDAILLILAILTQQRGAGLSITFGGNSSFFRKKRGPERILQNATIVFAIIFALVSLLLPFTPKIAEFMGL